MRCWEDVENGGIVVGEGGAKVLAPAKGDTEALSSEESEALFFLASVLDRRALIATEMRTRSPILVTPSSRTTF